MENKNSKVTETNLTEKDIAELLSNYLAELKSNHGELKSPNIKKIVMPILNINKPLKPLTEEQFKEKILQAVAEHKERKQRTDEFISKEEFISILKEHGLEDIQNKIFGEKDDFISKEEFKATLKENGLEDIQNKIFGVREKSKPENNTNNKPTNG